MTGYEMGIVLVRPELRPLLDALYDAKARRQQPRPLFTCPLALLAWTGVVAVWVYIVAAWVLA